ncbi:sterol 3-beta-glucosyltransferase [Drechslerella stenobrocha 248]|uniref:Sterol 3-beta-glucosyltransferase n=1 Tax=Drechslerella stenobrocha 248 TaxID=1043628 RepID=W7HXK1_9PEZI|nr:sterol 3-beta-glucosyltransferase [Drechslerella stenobrocha 248]
MSSEVEDRPTRSTRVDLPARARPRSHSPALPDRFKIASENDLRDVSLSGRGGNFSMHQSVFQMIQAAGSKVDFHTRFDSDIEEEGEGDESSDEEGKQKTMKNTVPGGLKDATKDRARALPELPSADLSASKRLSDSRFLPKNILKSIQQKRHDKRSRPSSSAASTSEDIGSSTELNSSQGSIHIPSTSRSAPVSDLPSLAHSTTTVTNSAAAVAEDLDNDDVLFPEFSITATALSEKVQKIFHLAELEEVQSEYPCWLLKTVLLQGYLYITDRHICFFAYMPKKQDSVLKSGHFYKRGRKNPRYGRYWFTLKGDVLSYYSDASELYFPSGNIDLRYAIHAYADEGSKDHTFTLVTNSRKYEFKADSATSAIEWTKALEKVIFRIHNDGDSVKVVIPIENVLDIEKSPVIEFADTFKLKVVADDESYAIDEYFFSFFSFGAEAFELIRLLVEDTTAQKIPSHLLTQGPSIGAAFASKKSSATSSPARDKCAVSPARSLRNSLVIGVPTVTVQARGGDGTVAPLLREAVRDTLLPVPTSPAVGSPRNSGEYTRRSMDINRRSVDVAHRRSTDLSRKSLDTTEYRSPSLASAIKQKIKSHKHSNSTSTAQSASMDMSSSSYFKSIRSEPSLAESSDAVPISSESEGELAASQLLSGSDIFQQAFPAGTEPSGIDRGRSPTLRNKAGTIAPAEGPPLQVHPPSRTGTDTGVLAPSAEVKKAETSPGQLGRSSLELSSSDKRFAISSPSLTDVYRVGSLPIRGAQGIADWMKRRSKNVASGGMGYFGKVTDMWTGGKKHYDDKAVSPADAAGENADADDEDEGVASPSERFRQRFALPESENLMAVYFGYLSRVLPLYGKIYLGDQHFCFRSMVPGTRTRMILPLRDVENVDKERGFRFSYHGLVVTIRGHEELFFEFASLENRDDCGSTLTRAMDSARQMRQSQLITPEQKANAEIAKREHDMLQEARQEAGHLEHEIKLPHTTNEVAGENAMDVPPIVFDDPHTSIVHFKPQESLRFTCLTIGSRGDVQPYIALCKGLIKDGHKARIATHIEFKDWVEGHGIEFREVAGDPAELMRVCVENGMFTISFLKEASSKFRSWIDELLDSAWIACQDSDVLIESPSAMAGIHIAEAMRIPYFRAFTMPWTRTRAYPHAFAVPDHKMGGAYNYFSYIMFDNVFWKAIAGQVNRWRKKDLHLKSTGLDKLQPNKVPFLYNFSPHVVIPPLDFSDWIRVTGYWFLDESQQDFEPPQEMVDFMRRAREDGKPIVYIGFGSIVVADPQALTQTVVDSVVKADVRCLLSKGWSDRLGKKDASAPEIPLPDCILPIKATPHDWLFRHIDAAVHHGGAGTTGASLRAGLPTVISPFFGDQFFFGGRVEDLGVGVCLKKLNVKTLSEAMWLATNSTRMITKARILGESIRSENGVDTAIQAIYRDMEYAKTLIKNPQLDSPDGTEESWTFVNQDESDAEVARRNSTKDTNSDRSSRATVASEL